MHTCVLEWRGAVGAHVHTLFAYCTVLVCAHAPLLGLSATFGLAVGSQQLRPVRCAAWRVTAATGAEGGFDGADEHASALRLVVAAGVEPANAAATAAARRLARALDGLKEDAVGARRSLAPPPPVSALAQLAAEYARVLMDASCLDLCDVEAHALKLLRRQQPFPPADAAPTPPGAPPVPPAVGAAYAHVLLDDFQDVSARQLELLVALVSRAPADGSPAGAPARRCGLTLAGDPHQSVFGSRGAVQWACVAVLAALWRSPGCAHPLGGLPLVAEHRRSGGLLPRSRRRCGRGSVCVWRRVAIGPRVRGGGGERRQAAGRAGRCF